MLLSALTGTAVEPAELLGTAKEERTARLAEAELEAEELETKMRKAGLA